MLRALTIPLLLLATATLLAAEDSIAELKQKAEKAEGGDRAKYYVRLAERMADQARDEFAAGRSKQGRDDLVLLEQYAQEAGKAAISSGKRLKKTEIGLRKVSKVLDDLRRSVEVEERVLVELVMDRLLEIRREILSEMFDLGPDRKRDEEDSP